MLLESEDEVWINGLILGEFVMRSQLFLAQSNVLSNPSPLGEAASPVIMIISCLLILFIASRTIQKPHVGPKMPLGPLAPIFNDISVAGFIGALSLGHILGALAILGLAR